MDNLRRYGKKPFSIAVLHGGPGASGGMAPVAQKLSDNWGVLEPLQLTTSIEDQVMELKGILDTHASLPVVMLGASWGAMLGIIFTARFPEYVKKLILIGSGVFEDRYSNDIMKIRLDRLKKEDREEADFLLERVNQLDSISQNKAFYRLGTLLTKASTYELLSDQSQPETVSFEVFKRVWGEAVKLRASGRLLEKAKNIKCPVVAFHGDYDPHPVEGVQKPLSAVLKEFRFILLEKCGHEPWNERQAEDKFFSLLFEELNT